MRHAVAALLLFAATIPAGQKPKPPTEAEKIAKEGVRVGDVFIRATGGESVGDISHIRIQLDMVCADDSKRVLYSSWNRLGNVSLMDDLENIYFHFKPNQRATDGAVLYSDRPAHDALSFERPVPKAKMLSLELDGENLGMKDKFKLRLKRGAEKGKWVLDKPAPEKKPKP